MKLHALSRLHAERVLIQNEAVSVPNGNIEKRVFVHCSKIACFAKEITVLFLDQFQGLPQLKHSGELMLTGIGTEAAAGQIMSSFVIIMLHLCMSNKPPRQQGVSVFSDTPCCIMCLKSGRKEQALWSTDWFRFAAISRSMTAWVDFASPQTTSGKCARN